MRSGNFNIIIKENLIKIAFYLSCRYTSLRILRLNLETSALVKTFRFTKTVNKKLKVSCLGRKALHFDRLNSFLPKIHKTFCSQYAVPCLKRYIFYLISSFCAIKLKIHSHLSQKIYG